MGHEPFGCKPKWSCTSWSPWKATIQTLYVGGFAGMWWKLGEKVVIRILPPRYGLYWVASIVFFKATMLPSLCLTILIPVSVTCWRHWMIWFQLSLFVFHQISLCMTLRSTMSTLNSFLRIISTNAVNKCVRAYALPGSNQCIVKLLDNYLRLLPPNSVSFYLRALDEFPTGPKKCSFVSQRIGVKSLFLICPDNLNVVSTTQTILYVPLQSRECSIVVCLKQLLRKIQVTRAQRLSVVLNTHQVSSKTLSVRSSTTLGRCFSGMLWK